MIRLTARTEEAVALLVKLRDGLSVEQIDPIVEKAALESLADIIQASPKKWFGQIRSGWHIEKPAEGSRVIDIRDGAQTMTGQSVSDIVQWTNFGTGNDGADFIYPKNAKRLYVPLTRRAAGGWHEGLVYGRDYVLALRVRGQKGQHFIEPVRERTLKRLRDALLKYVRGLIGSGSAGPRARDSQGRFI